MLDSAGLQQPADVMGSGGTIPAAVATEMEESWLEEVDGIFKCAVETSKKLGHGVVVVLDTFNELDVPSTLSELDAPATCGAAGFLRAFGDLEHNLLDALGVFGALGVFKVAEPLCVLKGHEHGAFDSLGAIEMFGAERTCG